MDIGEGKGQVDQREQRFDVRLKRQFRDPMVLAGPPVAAVLCLLRFAGLIAPIPYWPQFSSSSVPR